MSETTTVHVPEAERYELRREGETIGYIQVIEAGGNATIPHVEVAPAYEGQGLGSKMVGEALADIKGRGLRVIARCPFAIKYIERHPESVL